MLDKETLKWLEEREERFNMDGVYSSSTWIPSIFIAHALTPDWKDAAEFEARVAAKMAEGMKGDHCCLFACLYTLPSYELKKHPQHGNCGWCNMRRYRLDVEEEEMDQETEECRKD